MADENHLLIFMPKIGVRKMEDFIMDRSNIQIIASVETSKKFLEACLEVGVLPDETFKEDDAYVIYFNGVEWNTLDDEFTEKIREIFDELDGEDEEPYKMLRIGEKLTDLEERSNNVGSDAYDSTFYIVRDFSCKGSHFSRGGV